MMSNIVFVGIISFLAVVSCLDLSSPAIDKKLIYAINSNPQSSWVAGHNEYFAQKTIKDAVRLMGWKPNPNKDPLPIVSTIATSIPDEFDSSKQWASCTTIGTIYNQADCGSCWAFGCVEAVSDRLCIHKGAQYNMARSFFEETTCAPCDGCDGGDPDDAWGFVQSNGLVTADCLPYDIPTCPPAQQPCLNFVDTPNCPNNQCNNTDEWEPVTISTVYDVDSNETAIQTEIMTNGPVEACFTVYADFVNYKSGVYQQTSNNALGGHCIKIIGWGVENGLPYWLCNNSWTTTWGDDGQFKILRGQDECGIEDEVVAGMP